MMFGLEIEALFKTCNNDEVIYIGGLAFPEDTLIFLYGGFLVGVGG
jgi:hypothetical protein